MKKVGIQLYSLHDIVEKDFYGTLQKVANMGYEGVEFAGFFDHKSKQVRRWLDALGLTPCGSHTSIDLLIDRLDEVCTYNKEIGNQYLIIPTLPEEMIKNTEAWDKTADIINEINEKIKSYELTLGYHNHDFEFVKTDNGYIYDRFAQRLSDDILLEIDTYWVVYAKVDVLEYIKKYHDRLHLIHLKDMGSDGKTTSVGAGSMDFRKIIQASTETQWLIVEQEDYTGSKEKAVQKSLEYIKRLV